MQIVINGILLVMEQPQHVKKVEHVQVLQQVINMNILIVKHIP